MENGDAILSAIRTMRERLGEAISYSRGVFNYAHFGIELEADRVQAFQQRLRAQHELWANDFNAAMTVLVNGGYPVHQSWWETDIAEPQVAYCELPLSRYSDGTIRPIVWVIGSGENWEGAPVPDFMDRELRAGEWISGDLEGFDSEPDMIAGAFNDDVVKQWEAVHRELQAVEQRLIEAKLTWAPPLDPTADGPVEGFRWRHDGEITSKTLAPKAWRLVKHLFESIDGTASFESLAPIVNDDHADTFYDASTCRGQRDAANVFFRDHHIPLKVAIKGNQATLSPVN